MNQNKFKIAAAQAAPVFLECDATIEKACRWIKEAGENGAKLIVFPETYIPCYPDWVWVVPNSKASLLNELYIELVENSITIPDKNTERLCQAAKAAKIHVAIGVNERNSEASNASLFNTLLFID
ncbi:MAG: nitrilase-related carbon-nitrogen hydrolase, partial [Calditrichia bacterium]